MEPIDAADAAFKALVAEVTEQGYWDGINSEADTRMKVIDRVFVDILGWPRDQIHLESTAGKQFIDYRCTVDRLNRLIIEAKKEARDLGINADHAARFFRLNGAVFGGEAAQEGIGQAITYCAHKGAELACVTNGRQWAVFRGAKGPDGMDILESQACCFGSLEAVGRKFREFYELLAYEPVAQYSYRAVFREAEGRPVRHKSSKTIPRHPESKQMLPGDQLSADLDRIMQTFFRDLSGRDDAEARRACFVTTNESRAAEQGLTRISEELREKVKSLSTAESHELTEAIKRVREMKKNELVLLVGSKGAGKSTFIERFFADVLPTAVRDDCVIIRIDLTKSGGISDIHKWLDEHFLEAAEKAAYPTGSPTYEEIQGMFFGEYQRWMQGHAKHLYESNKTQFKIDFGRYVESLRQTRPHDYIKHLLDRVVQGHGKIPCLIFDNADHFNVPFQEAVFNYAHSLYAEAVCLVILPITDTTSWQLSKEGPIQSFYTDSFFLPTPPTELVLRRRIEFIEKKITEEQAESGKKPATGRGYFFARGMRLEIENIHGFAACLQTVFLNTGQVAEWIGRLANHDIRRCLQFTREIVGSPHIRVADLVAAHIAKTSLPVNVDDIKLAMIRGKYDIYYPTTQSFIHNAYNLVPVYETTPLLAVRLLQFLEGAYHGNADNDARYVLTTEIVEYFQAMNIDPRTTLACLDAMLDRGLCLSYDPTSKTIAKTIKLEVSPSGQQHLTWAVQDWIYIESMAEITPLHDGEAAKHIRASLGSGEAHLRRSAVSTLIAYLLLEDSQFCVIPAHSIYEEQKNMRTAFNRQSAALTASASIAAAGRYRRHLGRISSWKADRGFGFVRPINGDPDLFLHISEVLNADQGVVPEGVAVDFDIVQKQQGPNAVAVVLLT